MHQKMIQLGSAVLFALLAIAPCHAQYALTQSQVGVQGPILETVQWSGALSVEGNVLSHLRLLNTAYTGSEYRFELNYTIHRLPHFFPACAHVDVLSANGQVHGRARSHETSDSVSGQIVFYGDNHDQARPHRVRFTYDRTYVTADFSFEATLSVRKVTGANIGGPLPEKPLWVRAGTTAEPTYTGGDIAMIGTPHRYMMFYLEPQQEVKARITVPASFTGTSAIYFKSRHLDQTPAYPDTGYGPLAAGVPTEVLVTKNTADQPRWIVVGMMSPFRLPGFATFGFYSPQGAASTPPFPPPVDFANPYQLIGRQIVTRQIPAGPTSTVVDISSYPLSTKGTTLLAIPDRPASLGRTTGELTRLSIYVYRQLYVGYGTGAACSIKVFDSAGVQLLGTALTAGTHDPVTFNIEHDGTAAKRPARIEFSSAYEPSTLIIDVTRAARPTGPVDLPRVVSPAPGIVLPGASARFHWRGAALAEDYKVIVGSAPGGQDLTVEPAALSETLLVSGLPTDGRPLYVRVQARIGQNWVDGPEVAYRAANPAP